MTRYDLKDGKEPHPAYRVEGPAVILFSGGQTSAYMLHEILRAFDWKLPSDIHVCFLNTGKELEAALRFVHVCGSRWDVRIRWFEWRDTELGFEEVGYNSASRNGEPFSALIKKRGMVPNAASPFCSVVLKSRTLRNFAVNELGWSHWTNVVGMRYDEGHRILKMLARNETGRDRWKAITPLAKAKVTKRDISAFWNAQDFRLEHEPHEGNCDLCFKKNKAKLKRIIIDNPQSVDWWKAQEAVASATATTGAQFRLGETYADIEREVRTQPFIPGIVDDEEYDAECGLYCGEAA